MAIHSSILAWRILWTEESGGLQSMGSQRGDLACILEEPVNWLREVSFIQSECVRMC